MESMETKLLLTLMKKPLLIVNGYQHRMHRKSEKFIWWICLKERRTKCTRKVKTSLDYKMVSCSEHSCEPKETNIEIIKNNSKVQKKSS